LNLVFTSKTAT